MVGPARKREAVVHVRRRLEVSERRACQATGQSRSTQRYLLKRPDKDKALREEILKLSGKEKRAGCRTIWRQLRRDGWEVNHGMNRGDRLQSDRGHGLHIDWGLCPGKMSYQWNRNNDLLIWRKAVGLR
jgi:putative transposase